MNFCLHVGQESYSVLRCLLASTMQDTCTNLQSCLHVRTLVHEIRRTLRCRDRHILEATRPCSRGRSNMRACPLHTRTLPIRGYTTGTMTDPSSCNPAYAVSSGRVGTLSCSTSQSCTVYRSSWHQPLRSTHTAYEVWCYGWAVKRWEAHWCSSHLPQPHVAT